MRMNPLLKSREVAHYVVDSGAKSCSSGTRSATEAAKGAAGTGAQVLEVNDPTCTHCSPGSFRRPRTRTRPAMTTTP